jgi:hypothetical protein
MKSLYHTFLIVLLAVSFFLASCSKDVVQDTISETGGLVAVNADSTSDFGNYQTIAVNDSVVFTNGKAYSRELNTIDAAYINAWKDSLAALGYIVVDKTQNPDLLMNVTKVDNSVNNILDFSTYWKYYATLYKPSSLGVSGAQYVANFDNSQTTKDLLLSFEMIDLKNKTNTTLHVIWNGVVTDKTVSTDINQVQLVMEELLYQSPQLKVQ